jgi:two-component sensor histidine kinase
MWHFPAGLVMGVGAAGPFVLGIAASPARAAESGPQTIEASFATAILAGALLLSLAALVLALRSRYALLQAQKRLAALAGKSAAGAWTPTGVDDIDGAAQAILDLDRRLVEKRRRIAAGEDEIRAAEAHGRAMDRELHHRVNNTLAMIQGVANITARTAPDFESFRAAFSERLHCLGRISTLIVSRSWASTPLRELAETAIDDSESGARGRIDVSGDDVALRSDVALALGMALHELYSNAVRHGALANEAGRVRLTWGAVRDDRPHVALTWIETGGPSPDESAGSGVGLYLVRHVLSRQFEGEARIFMEPEGLRAELAAAMPEHENAPPDGASPTLTPPAPAASP